MINELEFNSSLTVDFPSFLSIVLSEYEIISYPFRRLNKVILTSNCRAFGKQ